MPTCRSAGDGARTNGRRRRNQSKCLGGTLMLLALTLVGAVRQDSEVCYKDDEKCARPKVVAYDVNPGEGFNLRRDVALRMLVFAKRARVRLALPPWAGLYHWRRRPDDAPRPWSAFFDVGRLAEYADVVEALDRLPMSVDTAYALRHFDDPFDGGAFIHKYELQEDAQCERRGRAVLGWANAKTVRCVAFQGPASELIGLVGLHPDDRTVAFANAEVALHDEYATAEFWRARRAFVFAERLRGEAESFIKENLQGEFLGVHWRRGDFARGRPAEAPSVSGTAGQIASFAARASVDALFLATDADDDEIEALTDALKTAPLNLRVVRYEPTEERLDRLGEGGVAIVDQIVCSKAKLFVGTHESTFSFRIQEEREIAGLEPDSTFNRLCPDRGPCDPPTRWRIVR